MRCFSRIYSAGDVRDFACGCRRLLWTLSMIASLLTACSPRAQLRLCVHTDTSVVTQSVWTVPEPWPSARIHVNTMDGRRARSKLGPAGCRSGCDRRPVSCSTPQCLDRMMESWYLAFMLWYTCTLQRNQFQGQALYHRVFANPLPFFFFLAIVCFWRLRLARRSFITIACYVAARPLLKPRNRLILDNRTNARWKIDSPWLCFASNVPKHCLFVVWALPATW